MTYRLEFMLLGLPSPERNRNRHWRTVRNEERHWKRAVCFAVMDRVPPAPLARARVTYTRHSSTKIDPDNLADSFKPITDALRVGPKRDGLPILIDDTEDNFVGGRPDVRWQKAPPGRGRITVLIEEEPHDGEGIDSGNRAMGPGRRQAGRAE